MSKDWWFIFFFFFFCCDKICCDFIPSSLSNPCGTCSLHQIAIMLSSSQTDKHLHWRRHIWPSSLICVALPTCSSLISRAWQQHAAIVPALLPLCVWRWIANRLAHATSHIHSVIGLFVCSDSCYYHCTWYTLYTSFGTVHAVQVFSLDVKVSETLNWFSLPLKAILSVLPHVKLETDLLNVPAECLIGNTGTLLLYMLILI